MTTKRNWTLTRSKMLHIYANSVPDLPPPISFHYALWPAVFELQVILTHVNWMAPKWPRTLQGQRCLVYLYVLLAPRSPKFHPVLVQWPTTSYMLFWDKWTGLPPNNLVHYKVHHKVHCKVLQYKDNYQCSWISTFSLCCSTAIHFREKVSENLKFASERLDAWFKNHNLFSKVSIHQRNTKTATAYIVIKSLYNTRKIEI